MTLIVQLVKITLNQEVPINDNNKISRSGEQTTKTYKVRTFKHRMTSKRNP